MKQAIIREKDFQKATKTLLGETKMKKTLVISMSVDEFMKANGSMYHMTCEQIVIDGKPLDPSSEVEIVLTSQSALKKEKIVDEHGHEKSPMEKPLEESAASMFG